MARKKYTCDFCHVVFRDNLPGRKRHFESVRHTLQKRLHYESFRERSTPHGSFRPICQQFLETGGCDSGSYCPRAHLLPGHTEGTPEHAQVEEFLLYIIDKYKLSSTSSSGNPVAENK